MRTAIFFGLTILAKAINHETTHQISTALAIFTVAFIIMDVIEFIKKITKD